MATFSQVDLPLYSDSFYSYQVSLEGISYGIEILYNERNELWHMSIFNDDDTPIIQGIALVPNYPILQDYANLPLTGYFWLKPVPKISSEKYLEKPESLAQYYTFSYIYNYVE